MAMFSHLLILLQLPSFSYSLFAFPCVNPDCPDYWVDITQIGDSYCDPGCMSGMCDYDQRSPGVSDCDIECESAGCPLGKRGDGVCDPECNIWQCGGDFGDCGYCAPGCVQSELANGICKPECDNAACALDGYDCGYCIDGCFEDMLADGHCDDECLNAACNHDHGDCDSLACSAGCFPYMINNLACDAACNTLACNYDGNDCFCSPGCTPEMLENEDCDPLCATEECGFDGYLCVSAMQGDCADGCFWPMVGDGTCNTECIAPGCRYDVLDCGCSPGCAFDMYGHCEFPCLVPDCGYDDCWGNTNQIISFAFQMVEKQLDTAFVFERDCGPKVPDCSLAEAQNAVDNMQCDSDCMKCAYAFGTCFTGNNFQNCQWGYGANYGDCILCVNRQIYTYCTDLCPRALPDHPHFEWLCYPAKDTSTASAPDSIFVTSTGTGENQGTMANPYFALSTAFAQNYMAYTTIYLLAGTHELTQVDKTVAEGILVDNPMLPLRNTFGNKELVVTTLMCTGSGDHSECAADRAIIHIAELQLTLNVEYKVTFDKVIIDGENALVESCTDPLCYYCPNVSAEDSGITFDDRGREISSYATQAACDPYKTVSLFEVSAAGTLVLSETEIRNIRHQPKAIIANSGGTLSLTDVDFSNIIVTPDGGAVIRQDSCSSPSYNCGSLAYAHGTVSYLNNGYELVETLALGGFLAADGLKDISLASITFTKNIAVNPKENASSAGLIALKNFRTFTVDGCSFQSNLVTTLISVRALTLSLAKAVDESNNVIDFAAEHIYIKDSQFSKNFGEVSMISTTHGKDMQNVKIENCQLTDNIAMQAALIAISFTGKLSTDITVGQTKTVALPSGSKVQGFFAPRHIRVVGCTFTRNLGFSLFELTSVANIEFSGANVLVSNGASSTQTYNDIIVQEFIDDSEAYLKERRAEDTPSITPCSRLIGVSSSYAAYFTSISFTSNYCDKGVAGISASKVSSSLVMTALVFNENSCSSALGAVLTIDQTAIAFTVVGLTAAKNTNSNSSGMGLLYFGEGLTVTVSNSQFTGNQIPSGGAIWAQDMLKLKVTTCTFESNTATAGNGGAIFSMPRNGSTQASLEITDCSFKSNQSLQARGGAVIVSNDIPTRQYLLTISSCAFDSNVAGSTGAALYIEINVALAAGSTVQSCTFTANRSQRGTVALYYSSGQLSIVSSKFTGNQSKAGSGIASTTQPAAVVSVTDTTFASNTSAGGVIALTDTDIVKTLVTMRCGFTSNSGTAVYVQNGKWTDTASRFEATVGSAVSLADGSVATLTSSQFTGNNAATSGGASYISSGSTLKCAKCAYARNAAQDKGGALFLEQSSKIEISGSSFDSNTCKDKGSAIFILGSLSPVSSITTSTFTGNAADNSGVISLLSSALSMTSVTVSGNTSKGITPGIVMTLSNLVVVSSTFSNQRGNLGGFVYATTESAASFTDSNFTEATAQSGGAFNVIGSTFTLTKCKLSSITAAYGAGFIAYSESSVTLSQVTMSHMTASDSALGYISEGSLVVTGSSFNYFGSGGIQADKMKSAYITDSSFSYGNGTLGGAFTCTRCQAVIVQNSLFHRNTANWGGGVYLSTQADAPVANRYQIHFTTFSSNSAWRGAGAYTNNVDVEYRNCSFLYNAASKPEDKGLQATGDWGRGGGAMSDCKDVTKCVFNFTWCYFAHNSAEVSGGGIAWQDVRPNITNSEFLRNQAEYGNDTSSFAVAIKQMTSTRRMQSIALNGVASGQDTTQSIVVALVDHYGGVVTTDSSSSAEIVPVDSLTTTVSGITKVTANKGIFTFDKFVIIAEPGTTALVKVQTSAIDTTKADKAKDSVPYAPAISITAEMRDCVLGESHVGKSCQVCEPGKYSLDPNSTACTSCPAEAICYGNYTMVPREGYWRARIDTDVFYKCLYVPACTGSPEPPEPLSLTGNCATGYTGNLCESCIAGYSRSSKYECAKCPGQVTNIIRLIFIAIAVAALAGVMVYTTMKSAQRAKSLSSIYIKILMNYLQIVILAASFNLSWPSQVLQLFAVQETSGSFTEQAFSVDCFLAPSEDSSSGSVAYNKLVVTSVLPLIIALGSVIAWVFIYVYRHYKHFPKDGLVATVVILLFLAHPTLTKYLFNIFTCMDVDGQFYLLQQLDVKCWDSTHIFYIVTCAVPAIVLWVLGVPAVCLVYLMQNKRKLGELYIRIRLGFLFNGYRPKAYYWEFVILYRKILIICCSVFLTTISIPVQALCVMFILVAAMYLQDAIRPFASDDLNEIELKSIMCATVTIYCGLFFLTGDLGSATKQVLFIAIVIVNAIFMWHWTKKMFGFYITLAVNKIPCLRRKLGGIRSVNDGLDDDLFISRRHIGLFMRRHSMPFTPIVEDPGHDLKEMKDLYLMKLRNKRFYCGEEEAEETPSGAQTPSCLSPPGSKDEVRGSFLAGILEVREWDAENEGLDYTRIQ